eukprot:9658468-Heterocapsa_arctica.AAC.1
MDTVGPIMEPELSEHQSAIRGGSCGPNVRKAFEHLGGTTDDSSCPDVGPLWDVLLGDLADAALLACQPPQVGELSIICQDCSEQEQHDPTAARVPPPQQDAGP